METEIIGIISVITMAFTEAIAQWKGLSATGRRATAWAIGIALSLLAAVSGELGNVSLFQAAMHGLLAVFAAQGLYSGVVKNFKHKQ